MSAARSLFGFALFAYCFFTALSGLSASLSILLLFTYPLQVSLGAHFFLGEKLSRADLLAFPPVFLGTALLVWGDMHLEQGIFVLFGIAASIFYSLYILLSSAWLRDLPVSQTVPFIQLGAALVLLLLFGRNLPAALQTWEQSWWLLLLIALVSTVFAMLFFFASQKRLKNWELSLLSMTEPLSAVALAILFLQESLQPRQIVGAGLVLLGLAWVARPRKA